VGMERRGKEVPSLWAFRASLISSWEGAMVMGLLVLKCRNFRDKVSVNMCTNERKNEREREAFYI
jgi:hypothetical protein